MTLTHTQTPYRFSPLLLKPLQAVSSADRPLPPLPARPSADSSSLQLQLGETTSCPELSSTAGAAADTSGTDSSSMIGVVSGGTNSGSTSSGGVLAHAMEEVQSPSSEAKNATKREKVRTLVVSHSVCLAITC